MPECAAELIAIAHRLEDHYKDMQDMEFTIQDGKLWMLQTRNGKRTGAAMVKIAMDLLREGEIDEKTVLMRMEPQKLDELLHPVFDKAALKAPKSQPRVCLLRPAPLPVRWCSPPRKPNCGLKRRKKLFWCVSRPLPRIFAAWPWHRAFSPCAAV